MNDGEFEDNDHNEDEQCMDVIENQNFDENISKTDSFSSVYYSALDLNFFLRNK